MEQSAAFSAAPSAWLQSWSGELGETRVAHGAEPPVRPSVRPSFSQGVAHVCVARSRVNQVGFVHVGRAGRALGGAAAAVIDLLENRSRTDLQLSCSPETSTQTRNVLQAASERGLQCGPLDPGTDPQSLAGRLLDPLAMLHDLQQAGRQGPAAALNNGLTDHENRLLFQADEPHSVVRLILTGLERMGIPASH